jgi:hypothetical protein
MIGYQPVKLRPLAEVPHLAAPPQMGTIGSMTVTDWLLLGGATIVAGAGLNSIYGGVTSRKPNFIDITLGVVLTAVGVTVVGGGVSKLTA